MRTQLLTKGLLASALSIGLAACASDCSKSTMYSNDDATISFHVNQVLAHDPQVNPQQVHVETRHGVVQLSGFVDNQSMEQRAVDDATKVDGVQVVKDNIIVQ